MKDKEFAEFVQRLELGETQSGCLADEQLAALASGTAGETDGAAWRGHLGSCLTCLQAYASLQALLDLPRERIGREGGAWYQVAWAHLIALGPAIIARTRRAMTVPIPLAWSAGAVVVATLLIHFVIYRPPVAGPHPDATPAPAMKTPAERAVGGGAKAADIRTAITPDRAADSSSPCGSKRWRIESVVTKNLISHLFVCGDGGPDDVVYVISGRPTEVSQRPDQTSAILEQARIQRLDGS
jgi:hypothetical protein